MDKHVVKIFISSTFREMIDERDAIQQIVFVKIRFWARQLGVLVIPVDLRWGITEADIEAGKLALQCEEAIEVSAPFFIGILGNTYGTDKKSVLGNVENQYYGKSVTDYEITKGVIESQNSNAIIYNITYSDKKENIIKKIKLHRLKRQIQSQNNLIDINIKERLISTMIADIKRMLQKTFSQIHEDDNLSLYEFYIKSSFYSQYYNTFFSKEYYNRYFDLKSIDENEIYLIKSNENETIHFFMYNAAHVIKKENLKVIYHDCGLPVYDSTCEGIMKHIIDHIYRDLNVYYRSSGDICEDFLIMVDRIEDFSDLYMIFLDSLNNLASREREKFLNFIIGKTRKRMIFFCSNFNNSNFFQNVNTIWVNSLSINEARDYISNYLHEYKKDNSNVLTKEIIEHLLRTKMFDISFVQLILNEVLLRGCPSNQIIAEIDKLTEETNSYGILKRILKRVLNTVSSDEELRKAFVIVCISLSLAEEYLTKSDLEHIVTYLGGIKEYVMESLELLNEIISVYSNQYRFRFDEARDVVRDFFAKQIDEVDKSGLMTHFSKSTISMHCIKEMLGCLKRQGDKERMVDFILSKNVFEMFYDKDLSGLYRELNDKKGYVSEKIKYIAMKRTEKFDHYRNTLIVDYLINCCDYDLAKEVILSFRNQDIANKDKWNLKLGYLERENGNYNIAISILQEIVKQGFLNNDDLIIAYDYLSYCYGKINMKNDSIKCSELSIELRRKNLLKYEFELPVSLNSLAYNYYRSNMYDEAVDLYLESCDIRIKYLGIEHPRVHNNMNNIGKVYIRNGKCRDAYSIFLKSYNSLSRVMGEEHNYTLICKMNCIVCELTLGLVDSQILLDEISSVKSKLEERLRYNDYLAYADFVLGCVTVVRGNYVEALQYLDIAKEYYIKQFGLDSFETKIINRIIKNNKIEMENIF